MLGAEISKLLQHTDYLVEERTESEVINKQSCSPGQGTKGPGAHWFRPHKAKLKEETSNRFKLGEVPWLILENTGKELVPP